MAKQVYQEYWDNARLVITTRLHAALPCLSRGIPVVLAKDNLSYRFAFLTKFLPIYSLTEFGKINWNPNPVNMEAIKEKILKLSAKRVNEAYEKYSDMMEISEFYETADYSKTPYFEAITDAIEYLDLTYSKNEAFHYCVWSVTQTADMVCNYVKRNYPNAILDAVIDRRTGIDFHGKKSITKEWLDNNRESMCFVCSPAAMPEAREYFKEIESDMCFLCWDDKLSR